MDAVATGNNETATSPAENGTFLHLSPTSHSTWAAASSAGRGGSVYVYVWLFLGLLLLLLSLLVIALHRLKNIISSSSSCSSSSLPECGSEGRSSFTNMEVCSISSRGQSVSSLCT
uniref:serine rich and transmembrane domain containing 1 n=1 Tax=Doryrhamphus excisus TaxID=161450 RepID=UPI0025AE30C7|nr:serine rich and transmembrane domain containing 1 [Doryrhamphus excisus]